MAWSFRALVAEHGEEHALALLQYQTGPSEFGAGDGRTSAQAHGTEQPADTPRDDDIHDETPYRPAPTSLLDLDLPTLILPRRTVANGKIWQLYSSDLWLPAPPSDPYGSPWMGELPAPDPPP